MREFTTLYCNFFVFHEYLGTVPNILPGRGPRKMGGIVAEKFWPSEGEGGLKIF